MISEPVPGGWQRPTVVIVEPNDALAATFAKLCESLQIHVETVSEPAELGYALRCSNPIGVVSGSDQDPTHGAEVLRAVGRYDRHLPVLLVTGDEPTVLGHLDAIEALYRMSRVAKVGEAAVIELVSFLFRAGRACGIGRLIPV